MQFRSDFHGSAKRLIESAGVEVTYKHVQEGVRDLETLTTTNTETPYTVKAFPTKLNSQEQKEPSFVDKDASVFLIANESLAVDPEEGDKITMSSKTFKVLKVQEPWYKATAAYWRIIVSAS